jgi:hypothetical protein
MEPLRWNEAKPKDHRTKHENQACLVADKGLDVANYSRASGGGRKMFLTSPLIDLIEQALALKFRLLSFPFRFDEFVSTRKMSSIEILRQSMLLLRCMPTCSRTLCPGSAFSRNTAVEPSMLDGCGSESTIQFFGSSW